MNILVVEDTPIAQMAVKNTLTKMGHNVTIAADGYEAIQKAKENKYDFIFMDIGLGDGPDGFQVTEQIKQNGELNSTTPITALTAHTEKSFKLRAESLGMVAYLTKPVTKAKVEGLLANIKND